MHVTHQISKTDLPWQIQLVGGGLIKQIQLPLTGGGTNETSFQEHTSIKPIQYTLPKSMSCWLYSLIFVIEMLGFN